MDNASPTTEHPTPPAGGPGPRVSREEMKDLGRLRRSVTDRHIAGVAGGLARHLDIDPIIVRVALVVAVFFGGAGLLAYVGAWILVPEEGTNDEPLGLDQRNRKLALAGVGVLAVLCAFGDWAGAFWFPWPLAIAAVVIVWFLNRKQNDAEPRSGYGYTGPPTSPTGTWATATAAPQAPTGSVGTDEDATTDADVDDIAATDTYGQTYSQTYEQGYGQQQYGWAPPPASYSRETRRRPRNPRRRGPILFFFTLALIALAEGVLGVVDLAGASITDSAYPALALGIIALMLLVGSFWGRAGGLIALGLVAALATAGATAGDHFPDDHHTYVPTTPGAVKDSYEFGGGEFLLDLSAVSDVDALDGKEISVDGVGGRVEVIVPDGMDVDVTTEVVAGDSRVFDQRNDGFDIKVDGSRDGGAGVPDMTINIDLVAGEIVVREAA
ncbi:phage shock protein PspC (stress-responsive transcriptional regulator) [Nocardioides sp. BE266]|uniref:PspC domain-containing protein n=1 Tax=Nocardioides sp. BE266 TaxID=2817725 RepID=UPI002856EFF4|nr:PspC domain-containing protein [Nocardioides sp. BE266]MDR7251632.1 phage shock protein PspC (stress-responsive transcriptional regulator) [Nocardioides sp. BE266]